MSRQRSILIDQPQTLIFFGKPYFLLRKQSRVQIAHATVRSSSRIITNVTRDLLNEEEKWRERRHFFLNKAVASVGWMSISQLNVQGLKETEVCDGWCQNHHYHVFIWINAGCSHGQCWFGADFPCWTIQCCF